MINLFGFAIRNGLTTSAIKYATFTYPSAASDIESMLPWKAAISDGRQITLDYPSSTEVVGKNQKIHYVNVRRIRQ